jgi:Flp pilus assembly protein TadG
MRRRLRERRGGAAAVELAVLLPFLIFLAVIGTDWARLLYFTISIEGCARAGALYAADGQVAAESPYGSLEAHAKNEASLIKDSPNLSVLAPEYATANSAGSDTSPTVKVTVTYTFRTITSFPGVPRNQSLSRSCEMRIIPMVTD